MLSAVAYFAIVLPVSDVVSVVTGEDVSENKDGSVLKSRIKNGQGINPPKDGAVCDGMYRICGFII